MSVRYKLYQDNRSESATRGKWYARAVYNSKPKTLKQLALKIQENVSVKKSDVMAVLDELVGVLKEWLQDSNRVKIEGLGSFKIGLKTKPANTAKDFSVAKHVVGARVNFLPEVEVDVTTGRRVKSLLMGLEVEETNKNDVNTDEVAQGEP
ncbi:MAG: HU family DNA-binding protein [Prevotella sp.]|nr:HU family DNA-binding protein [Prevotella sp.]MBR5698772.1 HU family DNA-binding protein [Prevotella sp.]